MEITEHPVTEAALSEAIEGVYLVRSTYSAAVCRTSEIVATIRMLNQPTIFAIDDDVDLDRESVTGPAGQRLRRGTMAIDGFQP